MSFLTLFGAYVTNKFQNLADSLGVKKREQEGTPSLGDSDKDQDLAQAIEKDKQEQKLASTNSSTKTKQDTPRNVLSGFVNKVNTLETLNVQPAEASEDLKYIANEFNKRFNLANEVQVGVQSTFVNSFGEDFGVYDENKRPNGLKQITKDSLMKKMAESDDYNTKRSITFQWGEEYLIPVLLENGQMTKGAIQRAVNKEDNRLKSLRQTIFQEDASMMREGELVHCKLLEQLKRVNDSNYNVNKAEWIGDANLHYGLVKVSLQDNYQNFITNMASVADTNKPMTTEKYNQLKLFGYGLTDENYMLNKAPEYANSAEGEVQAKTFDNQAQTDVKIDQINNKDITDQLNNKALRQVSYGLMVRDVRQAANILSQSIADLNQANTGVELVTIMRKAYHRVIPALDKAMDWMRRNPDFVKEGNKVRTLKTATTGIKNDLQRLN